MAIGVSASQIGCLFGVVLTAAGLRVSSDNRALAETRVWPFDFALSNKWDFTQGEITSNNLGGGGPLAGELAMVISHFAVKGDMVLDLRITAETPYTPGRPKANKLRGAFAQINVDANTDTTFKFQLLESGTAKQVTVDRFLLTIWDLDHGLNGVAAEYVNVGPISKYYLSDPTTVAVKPVDSAPQFYTFSATTFGDKADNPKDPYNVTPFERSHAVTVELTNMSAFRLNFAVKDGASGRNLLLSGDSALKPEPPPSICDAYTRISLDGPLLLNNLGGVGPEASVDDLAKWLRYGSVTTTDAGDDVDLVVTVPPGQTYQAADIMKNGKKGQLGQINLLNRTNVTLNFAFRRNSDDSLVALSNFWFTFFDIDSPNERAEYITLDDGDKEFPYDRFFVDNETALGHWQEDDVLHFRSTAYGTIKNNVIDPNNLDDRQRKNTVAFYFEGPATHFKFIYKTTGVRHGRNFQFGFLPTVLCREGNASISRSMVE